MPLETLLGIQLALYGVGWALAAAYLAEERAVLAHWSIYALLQSASVFVALDALRQGTPPSPPAMAANALGLVVAVRGVDLFASGRATLDRWLVGGLLGGLAAIVGASVLAPTPEARTAWPMVPYGIGMGIVLIGSSAALWKRLRRHVGRGATAAALLPTLFVGLLALVGGVMRLTLGSQELSAVHHAARDPNVIGALVSSAVFNFGFMFLFVSRFIQRLRNSARVDHLTGALNRRESEEQLAAAWQQHVRTQSGLAVALIDLDHFKAVNDRQGHAKGDQVLIYTARHLRSQTRAYERVGRWGGEEFLLLMPAVDAASAALTCERLRTSLADTSLRATGVALTASIGVAVVRPGDVSAAALVDRADRAMYLAKAGGRNRVCTDAELA